MEGCWLIGVVSYQPGAGTMEAMDEEMWKSEGYSVDSIDVDSIDVAYGEGEGVK